MLIILEKCGGMVASWSVAALYSRTNDPGSSPGRRHCVVFSGKTLNTHVPLSTQVYKWVPPKLMLRGNPAMD